MAIGLDTSVVLRLLIGEPRSHVEIARRRLERAVSAGDRVVVEALAAAAPARTGVIDRQMVARYRSLGALTATFDRRQARLEGGTLLRGGG